MSRRLDVLLAAEAVLPRPGGAERFALELLGVMSARHRVRALVIGEPDGVAAWTRLAQGVEIIGIHVPSGDGAGDWRRRRLRSRRMADAVRQRLRSDPADVVIGQLLTGAGAVAAARSEGASGAILLAGYEATCHWAFQVGSACRPETRCRGCPRALALPPTERDDMWAMRAEHDASLVDADLLVAPSEAMATACARRVGRRPNVVPWVVRAPRSATASPDGYVLLVSSVWSREKGSELLEPIARRLSGRRIVVQAPNGLPDATRLALGGLAHVEVRESEAEINDLLDGAALLLVPSQLPEPFGRVAFEGMAAGVPTLASATGGLVEFVPPSQLVQPPGDPDAWAEAVSALEPPQAWHEAQTRGRDAAAALLALEPAARIEGWLIDAASRSVAV